METQEQEEKELKKSIWRNNRKFPNLLKDVSLEIKEREL